MRVARAATPARGAVGGAAEQQPALLHRLSSRHHLLSAVLLVVCFLPLLWIARYNYPSGDDHIILLKAQRLGSWGATVEWYTGWTGRYTTFFILSVLGRYTDWFVSYRLIPVALLFAGFACSYAFIRALTGARLDTRTQFSLAACFYVVLISLTPDITTAFYWSGSNVMYAGGVFASVLAVAFYMRTAEESRRGKRWGLIASVVVLNAAVAGFNELSLLLLAAAIWWNTLLHFTRRRKVEVEGLVALASIALFGAASLLAPGNAVRAARVGAKIDVAASLFGSVALPVYLVFELMATTALLPATILYIAFLEAQRPRLEPALTRWTEPRWPWIALLMVGTIGAVTVPLFATVGVTSLVDRLKNVYVLSIGFGWLFLTTAVVADLWRRRMALTVPRWVLATLAVYVLCFLVTGFELEVDRSRAATAADAVHVGFALVDTRSVYADAYLDLLSGRAERYAAVNAAREQRFRDAGTDAVEIPLHSYVPETIFVQDVNHRWGVPDAMSEVFCGRVKPLRYIETGPPAPPKRKF